MRKLLSLQSKLTIVFIGLSFLTFILGVVFFVSLESVSTSFGRHLNQIEPITNATEQALISLDRSGSEAAKAFVVEEFQNLSDVQKSESDFNSSALNFRQFTAAIIYGSESEEFKKLDGGIVYAEWVRSGQKDMYTIPKAPDEIALILTNVNNIFDEFVEKNEQVFALKRRSLRLNFEDEQDEDINEQMSDILFEIDVLRDQIREEMNALLIANHALSSVQLEKVENSINQTRNITVIAIIAITITTILVGNVFAKSVLIIPIKKLQRGSEEIASGNYDFKVRLKSNDEIGVLAKEFNNMASQLKSRDKQINELTESLRLLNKSLRHDVLNDLSVIKGSIDTYFEYKDQNQNIEEIFNTIKEASKRSIDFIHKMKEVEQAVSTGYKLEVVNVRSVFETLREENKDLKIDVYGTGLAMADEALSSVFQNILTNVERHSGVKSAKVRIETHNNKVIVKISDEGKGVPNEAKERIFEEGFVYGKTGNTGLGLFIAKKTLDRYGGSIKIADNTPRGTLFVLTIPAAQG